MPCCISLISRHIIIRPSFRKFFMIAKRFTDSGFLTSQTCGEINLDILKLHYIENMFGPDFLFNSYSVFLICRYIVYVIIINAGYRVFVEAFSQYSILIR